MPLYCEYNFTSRCGISPVLLLTEPAPGARTLTIRLALTPLVLGRCAQRARRLAPPGGIGWRH
jgi:hypothetical protein